MFSAVRRYWPVVAATAVLVPHARMFDFVNDDAYISFRYARNLADHGQLVFNLGERVEGFTNFLWTVLLAAGMKLGINPLVSSRFLGIACAVGTLAVAVRLSARLDRGRQARSSSGWHLVAPVGLAATSSFACWCTGGLETQLFTFLSFLGFERLLAETEEGRGFGSGLFFALAAMTRPEGVLFFGIAGLFRLTTNLSRERRLLPRRHEVAWLLAFVLLFAPYFVWRWRYFGWPFPNTFYVKASGGSGTWKLGAYYLRRFAEDHGLFFLVPVAILGALTSRDRGRSDLFRLTVLVWAIFAAYVLKVGGDFMGLYRFVVPVLPLGIVSLQEALRAFASRLRPLLGSGKVAVATLGLAGTCLAAGYLVGACKVSRTAVTWVGADNGIDSPAYLKKYADDRIPVGRWFRRHARPDDLMTVGGAGVIPYYAGIAAYDVFGLVDQTIAHDPSMTVSNRPGHQKWGPDHYMLSRKPTLITHHYCLGGPCGEEGLVFPGYEWVRADIPGVYYSFLKRADRAFGPLPARSP
jgi:arabinofuranosyltransferase